MKEAMFYERIGDSKVRCHLCAHQCVIPPNKRGICSVRENRDGTLYSLVYGKIIARHIDPIEKKPLFHFYPTSRSYSIATVGCNFKCLHCQNYQISQLCKDYIVVPGEVMTPEDIVREAETTGCKSISYTYTEPTIFFEFAYDCAKLAKERGIKNVFVSNGYTSSEAARAIAPYLDANNIDLKGDENFYKSIVGAKLQPVLDTIKLMRELGVWIEITTLIIPNHNDSENFLKWVAEFIKSIDPDIPWHVSQFYPTYRLTDQPRTPVSTLRKAREIGLQVGLRYVYMGNVPREGGENTYCPSCGQLLIERTGFFISNIQMKNSRCLKCNTIIAGVGMP
ncbi:MAG: AmmeMemoRadiSam system radical SAM enzyme [Thermodesulfovibrionales bacterium]|nr:AmmeMemoRadiSam system radical SAM enzyme [Thermodesulfovibrionales bacterium]